MINLIFNGVIHTQDQDKFIQDFNQLLQKHNSTFKGTCRAIEFEDVEFIED